MTEELNKELRLHSSTKACENCGASLSFFPSSKQLGCKNCGSLYSFPLTKKEDKFYLSDAFADFSTTTNGWATQSKVIKCDTCGADVPLQGLQYATLCPYCNSNFVADFNDLVGVRPDSVIPFAFDEKEAVKRFHEGIKKKFFAPHVFKKQLPESQVSGRYIPAFAFDFETFSTYDGRLYRTESYVRNGKTYTRKKHFYIDGTNRLAHINLVIESSTHLDESDLHSMRPYNMEAAVVYTPDLLRGYTVEHYEDSLECCTNNAKLTVSKSIERDILSEYSYSGVDYLNVSTNYTMEKYTYTLLPLYEFTFTYKKKKYQAIMNGQTGKIGKGLPISIAKVSALCGVGLCAIVGIILAVLLL